MIKERYTIIAIRPDGQTVHTTGRTLQTTQKIKRAMEARNYKNIRLFKKTGPSPHVLFAQGLQTKLECSPRAALDIYRKVTQIMADQGIEFTRKETTVHA